MATTMASSDESVVALPAEDAARLASISRDQLARWDAQGIVGPSVVRRLSPRRTIRLYGFVDLLALLVAAELRQHVTHQHLAKVVAHLRSRSYARPLTEVKFAVEGGEIYFMHADGTWEGGRKPDQIVIHQVINLTPLRARILAAKARPAEAAGRFERKRGVRASKPVFAGTRIPVETVRGYLANGYSAKDVIKAYPSLTLEDVEAVRSAS
jgi:uncharacterized protein (DUF433 family)